MNNSQHLLFNVSILIIVSFILFKFGFNVLNLNMYHLFFAVYLFSNLPDIDHAKSKITKTFYFVYLVVLIYGILQKDLTKIMLALILFVFHFSISKDSKHHRSFPHKWWFGAICSLILWPFTSLSIVLIGFGCFLGHLIADRKF